MKIGVYYHPDFANKGYTTLKHRVKPGFDALQSLIKAGKIEVFTPVINQQAEELLRQTHHDDLINRVKATPYHEVALLSAAGVIEAAEKLYQRKLEFAFCFVGSGGHHAGYNYTWGFCYYNDVAFYDENMKDTVASLQKLLQLDFDTVFCAHSGVVENGKAMLQEKLNYLLNFQEKVEGLRRQGLTDREIDQKLFPKIPLITKVSRGEWSSYNIVSTI
jgi:hypothetical protein